MNFNQKVYQVVKQIPRGRVATYGQIAALVGSPRAARQVGWALHQVPLGSGIPWQRVINRYGMISTTCAEHTPDRQRQLLKKDGVTVTTKEKQFFISLPKFLWQPK